ncbi:Vsp/OspC family lipoprotein [Borrelia crocidurae]|nr:Vsp/OspC family lipoprotein [Borrelia crocidurae]
MKEKKGLGEIGRRDERREGRREGREKRRIVMVMMVVMMVMGCNSGGGIKEGEEGKARKGDGSVIDLKVVGEKIKSAVEFAGKVKEVHTLVKSVDELAKAIGKKFKQDGTLEAEQNHNGSLLAGVFQLMSDVKVKLDALEQKAGISNEMKSKVSDVKTKVEAFSKKLKDNHTDLGKKDATDANAKKAIDIANAAGDKGANDLIALNTAIDGLLKGAEVALASAIKELTTPPSPVNN